VSLVPVANLDRFLTDIRQKYPPYKSLDAAALGQAVFATAPGCGAGGTSNTLAILVVITDIKCSRCLMSSPDGPVS
jgi:hypothetical protein